jgi:hypothetical protein
MNRNFEDVFKIFLIYIVCPFCSKILENKNIFVVLGVHGRFQMICVRGFQS